MYLYMQQFNQVPTCRASGSMLAALHLILPSNRTIFSSYAVPERLSGVGYISSITVYETRATNTNATGAERIKSPSTTENRPHDQAAQQAATCLCVQRQCCSGLQTVVDCRLCVGRRGDQRCTVTNDAEYLILHSHSLGLRVELGVP